MEFPHLFSPLRLGNITVRNRIYSPPHAPGFTDANGLPSDRLIAYWEAKAKGGTAMVATGVQPVHPTTGLAVPFHHPLFVERMAKAAEAMHRHGAYFIIQPWHGGTQSGGVVAPSWAPSAVSTPRAWNVPHVMDKNEIKEVIDGFAFAAKKIKESGADGIEIHGAHGYLITEFASPYFNKRTDEYGGSIDNRRRFVQEIVCAVREAVGSDYLVGMRFSADEFTDPGLNVAESQELLAPLAETGWLDYLDISVGNYESMATIIAPMYVPLGAFVHVAAAIKEVVDIPVFCVGRIVDPYQAEQIIANGWADMVAMNRAIIADPEFANKAREGRVEEIRKCTGCNEACWGRSYMGLPDGIGCTVNPSIGYERETEITPAPVKKRVMVIGGGPAGLETARVAAMRGHQVSLYEKGDRLGGQILTAVKAPLRIDLIEPVRYFTHQMKVQGVDVHLNQEATPDTVAQEKPDVVVVATGATAYIPEDVPGAQRPNVVDVRDVLDEKVEVGQRVLVIAGENHQQALSTAEFLADRGKEVQVISPRHFVGEEIEWNTITLFYPRLLEKGVEMLPLTWVKEIGGETATVYNVYTREEQDIPYDTVVFATGGKANDGLYHALKGQVKEIYAVGDAIAPRRIMYAVRDGNRVGRTI